MGSMRISLPSAASRTLRAILGACIVLTGSMAPAVAATTIFDHQFNFDGQGWSFHTLPQSFAQPTWEFACANDGGLSIVTANNTNTFGWFESPAVNWSGGNPSPSRTLLVAQYTLYSNQSDPMIVPQLRLRSTAANSQQADLLTIESNSPGWESPTMRRTQSMYWYPPTTSPSMGMEFDLLNFGGDDSTTGSATMDRVFVASLPGNALDAAVVERDYDFTSSAQGFSFHSLPGVFTPPTGSHDSANGRLTMHFGPITTGGFTFGWWGSPEDQTAVVPQPGKLYLAEFTVESDQADPTLVPSFRLRVNESSFQLSQQLVVASTSDGANSPTLGNPRTYTVVFPAGQTTDTILLCSMDAFSGSGDGDSTNANLYLNRLRIRSINAPTVTAPSTPYPDPPPATAPELLTIQLPCGIPLYLQRIPAGSFTMGAPISEAGSNYHQRPVHNVTIPRAFYMGKYEVTQSQWTAIMGNNPSHFQGPNSQNNPVDSVSWNDAQVFVAALNDYIRRTGQGPATVRLPSEAEWEYSCRAGSTTRFYFGDSEDVEDYCEYAPDRDENMWYCGNGTGMNTQPVGLKKRNAFKLYDMHGNVKEWCQDWNHDTYDGAPTDGSAWIDPVPPTGERVYRGGAYETHARRCRSARRSGSLPDDRPDTAGFRLAADQ